MAAEKLVLPIHIQVKLRTLEMNEGPNNQSPLNFIHQICLALNFHSQV